MPFSVYIIQSESTSEIYIGQTSNLERRIAQHNDPDFKGTLHTKRRKGPWWLLYHEEFPARYMAMKREKELKSGKGRQWIKNHVIANPAAVNPPEANSSPTRGAKV
ncbi:MAG TPA: GIY-YIG nuclease family protein [Candidatus Sumerlaeota bacterium]|jgi:putative endonuclease|nr:GIY-YIG nuclease family protein [Candidatus Sumerlaeota bacterium]HON48991.1 GIY-YIG nuclease family protein [Candidatus Sumerlaeota bacterium]HOR65745.1 GIY-YIG nuclease family protein [Candidatus Sumerlaeota bacterium]HPL75421.1 GIY-YIG nuclease family protein [Candidatus Sumerlaeota bacterium]HRR31915.1 GIY-YIG nuclease family protein [Candidatus Sumerlaeia bacterium]